MNDSSNRTVNRLSMEEGVNALLNNARDGIRQRYETCETGIRKYPAKAVLGAVVVGYFLNRLPVRAILITQVRVLSALTPPTLFLFGAAKLYGFLQKQDSTKKK